MAPNKTGEALKELLSDLVRKSWNATRFMEGSRKLDRQHDLRTLWADKHLVDFDLKGVQPSISHNGMWPGPPA